MHANCYLTEFSVVRCEVLWHGGGPGTVQKSNRTAYTCLVVELEPVSSQGWSSYYFTVTSVKSDKATRFLADIKKSTAPPLLSSINPCTGQTESYIIEAQEG